MMKNTLRIAGAWGAGVWEWTLELAEAMKQNNTDSKQILRFMLSLLVIYFKIVNP
jgi:hypothetical protein